MINNKKEKDSDCMKDEFIERVYETLQGDVAKSHAVPNVENLYGEGKPCRLFYEEMLSAYERVRDRLGVVDEDEDVEQMINALLSICRINSMAMYKYGEHFALEELFRQQHKDLF